jgi:hypothetical protein
MTFASIPAGSSVFLDANPLVYHFSSHPVFQVPCEQLLQRIARQDLLGFTKIDLHFDHERHGKLERNPFKHGTIFVRPTEPQLSMLLGSSGNPATYRWPR